MHPQYLCGTATWHFVYSPVWTFRLRENDSVVPFEEVEEKAMECGIYETADVRINDLTSRFYFVELSLMTSHRFNERSSSSTIWEQSSFSRRISFASMSSFIRSGSLTSWVVSFQFASRQSRFVLSPSAAVHGVMPCHVVSYRVSLVGRSFQSCQRQSNSVARFSWVASQLAVEADWRVWLNLPNDVINQHRALPPSSEKA